MIQRMDQFLQAGPPQTVVPGKERPGRNLVGGLPRTNLHRINVTATEQGTKARCPGDSSYRLRRLARHSPRGM